MVSNTLRHRSLRLTREERHVVELVSAGRSLQEAAMATARDPATVQDILKTALRKLAQRSDDGCVNGTHS